MGRPKEIPGIVFFTERAKQKTLVEVVIGEPKNI